MTGDALARADIRVVSLLQRVRYALWRRGWFQVVRTSGQLHSLRVGRLVFYLRPLWRYGSEPYGLIKAGLMLQRVSRDGKCVAEGARRVAWRFLWVAKTAAAILVLALALPVLAEEDKDKQADPCGFSGCPPPASPLVSTAPTVALGIWARSILRF